MGSVKRYTAKVNLPPPLSSQNSSDTTEVLHLLLQVLAFEIVTMQKWVDLHSCVDAIYLQNGTDGIIAV